MTYRQIFERADEALYAAKQRGKDRTAELPGQGEQYERE